jgi:hypothetical protein
MLAAPAAADEVSLGRCGWGMGSDPVLLNVLYPDEDATYFTARLVEPPPGVTYRLRGEYPHARYMSFVTYNGLPIDALLDADIPPDPGATNPFRPRAKRTATRRGYTVDLVFEPPPAQRRPGALYAGGGQHGTPGASFYVMYRVYVPDRGTGPVGGVDVPEIQAVGAGSGDLSALPCGVAGSAFSALPLASLHEQYATTSVPPTPVPATPSATATPQWSVETGLTAGLLGRAGQGDAVSGGPASNPHNRYLAATVSRAHGEVLAIRARAPTTPRTVRGQPRMGTGDLRYWSVCQNSRTTRYIDCLSDSDAHVDADGFLTLAVSDPAHRPATARNWLPFGPEPEGQILYRHMLPSPAFLPRSAHRAPTDLPLEETMGDFFPRSVYCSAEEFDRDRCGLDP